MGGFYRSFVFYATCITTITVQPPFYLVINVNPLDLLHKQKEL